MAKNKKDKAALDVEVQFRDRRLLLEGLKIVPEWAYGFVIWWLVTKLFLDRLSEKKPGTEINAAILLSDVAGVTFPPGVALAAQLDVILSKLGLIEDLERYADEILRFREKYPPGETGRPSPEVVGLLYTLQKYVVIGVGVISGAFTRKEWFKK